MPFQSRSMSLQGLAQLTRGTNVTVNSVLAGPTWTGGVQGYMRGLAEQAGKPSPLTGHDQSLLPHQRGALSQEAGSHDHIFDHVTVFSICKARMQYSEWPCPAVHCIMNAIGGACAIPS